MKLIDPIEKLAGHKGGEDSWKAKADPGDSPYQNKKGTPKADCETEEHWFPLWEFKGSPTDKPETYEQFSPSTYAREFKTPTLVIHGELDFRDVTGQGLQLFTTLQQQKVPSKLLLFPDGGHWVLKPQNSLLWYHTVLDWIGEWT